VGLGARLGVIPQDAKLTPWPDDLLKRWDQLTADEKKMFIRQADVFAAYWAYTDHEIGRVIQHVEDMGKLDNTLIIDIAGDKIVPKAHRSARRTRLPLSMALIFPSKKPRFPTVRKPASCREKTCVPNVDVGPNHSDAC
jgi:hypothetical protein